MDIDEIQKKLDDAAYYLANDVNTFYSKEILKISIAEDLICGRITREEYERRMALLYGTQEEYLEVLKLYGPEEEEDGD